MTVLVNVYEPKEVCQYCSMWRDIMSAYPNGKTA